VFFVRRRIFVSMRPWLDAFHGLQYEAIKR
jgi:hypothetical protein